MFCTERKKSKWLKYGGYSAKVHDGTFLYDHKDEIKEKFPGGVFIGDNHLLRGKNNLQER